jgi:hypothetical protein
VKLTKMQEQSLLAMYRGEPWTLVPSGPRMSTADGTEGRCESCRRPVQAGELVHVIDDGAEHVVVHARACGSLG